MPVIDKDIEYPVCPWEVFHVTAYTADCKGCSGITADGTRAYHDLMIVSADTRHIEIGSQLELETALHVVNVYTVRDRGGKIKGKNRIDLLVKDRQTALLWGHKRVLGRNLDCKM